MLYLFLYIWHGQFAKSVISLIGRNIYTDKVWGWIYWRILDNGQNSCQKFKQACLHKKGSVACSNTVFFAPACMHAWSMQRDLHLAGTHACIEEEKTARYFPWLHVLHEFRVLSKHDWAFCRIEGVQYNTLSIRYNHISSISSPSLIVPSVINAPSGLKENKSHLY